MKEIFYKPVKAKCPDGKMRTVRVKAFIYDRSLLPDTAFTVPARAKVKGKTVSGFVTPSDGLGWAQEHDSDCILEFVAYSNRKNYWAFNV